MRAFLLQLAAFAAVFAVENVVVMRFVHNSQPHRILRAIDKDPDLPSANTLAVGDSTFYDGFDVDAFQQTRSNAEFGGRPWSIALWQTTPLEHLILLRRALKRVEHLDLVIYAAMDMRLTERRDDRFFEWHGNQTMSYFTDVDLGYQLQVQTENDLFLMKLFSLIPMVAERSQIHNRVNYSRVALKNLGMPIGRHIRIWENTLDSPERFKRRLVADRADHFWPPVSELFRTAKERGARVLVVNVPVMKIHRDRFYSTPEWAAYHAKLKKRLADNGVDYLDASDWIADDCFQDEIHLMEGERGARQFSSRLAKEVDAIYPEARSNNR